MGSLFDGLDEWPNADREHNQEENDQSRPNMTLGVACRML